MIGMVHVLLPYAVLPIYAAMVRIDRRCSSPAKGWAPAVDHVPPRLFPAVPAGL